MLNKEAENTVKAIKQSGEIGQKEFTRILKESKAIQKKQRKEYTKIANKPVMIQRLVYYYLSGFYSIKQIASMMCVTEQTIRNLLQKEEVQKMINDYLAEEKSIMDSRIKALSYKAVETVSELMDSDDDSVRLSASKDILDRAGYKPSDKKDVNVNISYEQQLEQLISDAEFVIYDDGQEITKGVICDGLQGQIEENRQEKEVEVTENGGD